MPISPELLVIGGQTIVAGLITVALLWYTRLFRETERRANQIEAINEIALTINARLDLAETFRAVTVGTHRLIPFDRACLALLDETGAYFRIVASTEEYLVGQPGKASAVGKNDLPRRIPRAGSAAGWAIAERQTWVSRQLKKEPAWPDAGILWAPAARWCVALPLSSRGEPIGVFSISGDKRVDLDEDMLEALQSIAEQVAVAISNAQLYAETRALAEELEERVEERTRELREAQERVMRSEKLAVAGHLAAAMAHEINNPLQSMRLYLELVADYVRGDPACLEYLSVVEEQIDRIAGIVSKLLEQLYQPAEESFTRIDLNELLQELIMLFGRRLPDAQITVDLDLAEELPPILGPRNGIRQVCMNILVNAIEAMPDGGTLSIASRLEGEKVYLTFRDSGVGMPPHVLRRVFDPFFTTKSNGTGLGMAVSYRIIQEIGGDLMIESQLGAGTRVQLVLPVRRQIDELVPAVDAQPR